MSDTFKRFKELKLYEPEKEKAEIVESAVVKFSNKNRPLISKNIFLIYQLKQFITHSAI